MELYDFFWFPDDDILSNTEDINEMFRIMNYYNLFIAQPSLTLDSFYNWEVTLKVENNFLRFVRIVEVMCPFFSKYALSLCLPTFTITRSNWGLDCIWSKLLNYPKEKIAIFDSISVTHTIRTGTGELYKKIEVNPYLEFKFLIEHFQADSEFINYSFITKAPDLL